MTEADTEYSGVFANELGSTVFFGLGDEAVKGTVKEVERGSAVDEWPEEGETVTFKAVGGEVEKTVVDVDSEREYPIEVDHGGRYRRTNFVEYTVCDTYRIIEFDDGREVWPDSAENTGGDA